MLIAEQFGVMWFHRKTLNQKQFGVQSVFMDDLNVFAAKPGFAILLNSYVKML